MLGRVCQLFSYQQSEGLSEADNDKQWLHQNEKRSCAWIVLSGCAPVTAPNPARGLQTSRIDGAIGEELRVPDRLVRGADELQLRLAGVVDPLNALYISIRIWAVRVPPSLNIRAIARSVVLSGQPTM